MRGEAQSLYDAADHAMLMVVALSCSICCSRRFSASSPNLRPAVWPVALTLDCRLSAGKPSSSWTLAAKAELTEAVEMVERTAEERSMGEKAERSGLGSRPWEELECDVAEGGSLMDGVVASDCEHE